MASGVNKVILVGNLGKDPEVRYTQSGNAVTNLRVAISERRKDGDTWKDHTEWVDVVVFGKTAENAGQYLTKGSQLYAEGRLQTRQYTGKDGVEKYRTEVVAERIVFVGGRGSDTAGNGKHTTTKAPTTPAPDDGFADDNLPF